MMKQLVALNQKKEVGEADKSSAENSVGGISKLSGGGEPSQGQSSDYPILSSVFAYVEVCKPGHMGRGSIQSRRVSLTLGTCLNY